MPLPDLVKDRELLKRILEHYKYRLEYLTTTEEIKPLMSPPVRRHLTFGQVKTLITQILNDVTKASNSETVNLSKYEDLLRSAASQYVKDLEWIKRKCTQELSDIGLKELEAELEAVKQYLS